MQANFVMNITSHPINEILNLSERAINFCLLLIHQVQLLRRKWQVYCSASSNYSSAANAYQQYIESIAPGAFEAYQACERFSSSAVEFTVDPNSILPGQAAISVSYSGSGDVSATLRFVSSADAQCKWNSSHSDSVTIHSPGGAVLNCTRADVGKKSFVSLIRADGIDRITFPWAAYDKKGLPIDLLNLPSISLVIVPRVLGVGGIGA
jgi:hypothetical protein